MNIQLIDASFIYDQLNDTFESIKQVFSIKEDKSLFAYGNLYTQIQIVLNLFKSIKNETGSISPQYLNMQIVNNDLLQIKNIETNISHLYLLDKLNDENYICPSILYILYNEDIINVLKVIYEMLQDRSISQFGIFISKLNENYDLIPEIGKLFPYHLFNDGNHPFYMIRYWIPLFEGLYEHQITFNIEITQTYTFTFSSNYSGVIPTYIFKEENSLNISTDSKFIFPNENKQISPRKIPKTRCNNFFYFLTILLFDNNNMKYKEFISHIKPDNFKRKLASNKTKKILNLSQYLFHHNLNIKLPEFQPHYLFYLFYRLFK